MDRIAEQPDDLTHYMQRCSELAAQSQAQAAEIERLANERQSLKKSGDDDDQPAD